MYRKKEVWVHAVDEKGVCQKPVEHSTEMRAQRKCKRNAKEDGWTCVEEHRKASMYWRNGDEDVLYYTCWIQLITVTMHNLHIQKAKIEPPVPLSN